MPDLANMKEFQETWKELQEKEKEKRNQLQKLVDEGKIPQFRALTRKERKQLAEVDVNKIQFDPNQNRLALEETMYDFILNTFYADFDWDSQPNPICRAFALVTYQLTYGDEIGEKN